ncbi:MAG: hypothetical protein R3C08_10165 [Hyphomonas sp.]
MQTAAANATMTAPARAPREDARDIYDRAGKAFAMVEKYQTPPDPDAFFLWYTYVSGTDAELNARVDAVLASTGTLSHYDVEAICQELAARGEGEVGLPHRSGPPDLLARRFPRSGVHAATSPQ